MRDKEEDNNQDNLGQNKQEQGGQKKNMKTFVDQYGVSMEIPAFYIQAAKIFPADERYCLQVVNYVLPKVEPNAPESKKLKVRTHPLDGHVKEPQDLKEVYDDEKYTCSSLKLMQQSEQAFKEVKEISLGKGTEQSKVSIEFSPDG